LQQLLVGSIALLLSGLARAAERYALDPAGERLEWTRSERDDASRTSTQRLIASFDVPRPPAIACIELGAERLLLIGGDEIGGWLLELGARREASDAGFVVRDALDLSVLPRAACFDAREEILYVVDGRSHAIWCAALDVGEGDALRVGPFVRALEGIGSRVLADRRGVEAGLVSLRLEEGGAARIGVVHAMHSLSELYPRVRGGRRALPPPSREGRWWIESSPAHEISTEGFWVRGPRGVFEVLDARSRRVIACGTIEGERAYFAGEGRLVSGGVYGVRGAGAAPSASIVACARAGVARGTAALEIGRARARTRETRAGRKLFVSAGLRCAQASRRDRQVLVLLAFSANGPGTSEPWHFDASAFPRSADLLVVRALRVSTERQGLPVMDLGVLPATLPPEGLELRLRVGALIAGDRGVALSDELGVRIGSH
jgi:hypothetical protein